MQPKGDAPYPAAATYTKHVMHETRTKKKSERNMNGHHHRRLLPALQLMAPQDVAEEIGAERARKHNQRSGWHTRVLRSTGRAFHTSQRFL